MTGLVIMRAFDDTMVARCWTGPFFVAFLCDILDGMEA